MKEKQLVAFVCLAGFFITISITPFIYFMKDGGKINNIAEASAISTIKKEDNIFKDLPVKAGAVAIYDTTTGKFIYTKNEKAQLPLASITKVMTAVSALRIAEKIKSSEQPIKFAGKWWNLLDLMKYSLVSSSNSGIASIAEAVSIIKNKKDDSFYKLDFIGEMNIIAKELKLPSVFFLNETGLDVNERTGGAYGSAKDISKMFSYAIQKYPDIFSATKYSEIKIKSEDGEEKISRNTNTEVDKMTMLIASKTGTTDLAGGNLVIAFDAGISHPIVITLLASTPEDRFKDSEILADAVIKYLSK